MLFIYMASIHILFNYWIDKYDESFAKAFIVKRFLNHTYIIWVWDHINLSNAQTKL